MSKSGKQIVAEAAKRAAEYMSSVNTLDPNQRIIAQEFAPCAELIEGVRTIRT